MGDDLGVEMVNLLLVDVNEVNGDIIWNGLQQIKVDRLYVTVSDEEQRKRFEKCGVCYYTGDIVRGRYSDEELDLEHCLPLEDEIFECMDPYLLEILNQQRRYEQHHAFQVSNTWENHYNTYMKNLFFFYNLLERKQITHIFFHRVPHQGYQSIIYHLAKRKNIPMVMAFNSLIPRRDYALTDYMKADEEIRREYERLQTEYQDTSVDDIELEGITREEFEKWSSLDPSRMKPCYMGGNRMKKTFYARYGNTNVLSAWHAIIGKEYEKYGSGMKFYGACVKRIPKLMAAVSSTVKQWSYARPYWIRTRKAFEYYESVATVPRDGEKYIYFAMHYQPEATSNPLGRGAYCDQRVPIQILCRSVPEDIHIYVKAHPDQQAFFLGIEYYKDLLRMPQVRLMKMECSTYDLMRNAVAVASLTGTACWECQFFNVPAILFGYSYKNASPLAYHVRTVRECKEAVRDIQKGNKKTTLKELKLYTKAAHNLSYPVSEREKVFPELMKRLVEQGLQLDCRIEE